MINQGCEVGVVLQDFKLLPDKTIYENVKFSLDVTGYPRKKKHEQVLKVLRQVGIASQKDKYPNELSGGQQQRAAIARAIVDEPNILVCDEPTGNLDPENAIQIMEIITEINESGTTVLMATHDVGIVNKYKHRVVLMKNGRISNEGEGGKDGRREERREEGTEGDEREETGKKQTAEEEESQGN